MKSVQDRLADAIKIEQLMRGSGSGCLEIATAALGGNMLVVETIANFRKEGRLTENLTDDGFLDKAGLKVEKAFHFEEATTEISAEVEKELEKDVVSGALVISSDHVFAVIHRRHSPIGYDRMKQTNCQLVIDADFPEVFRTDFTLEDVLVRNRHKPDKVVVVK